jgi:hypothetical protein
MAAPVQPPRLDIIWIRLRMQQQQTVTGMLYLRRQKHHQQRKRRQQLFWVDGCSSRATFQLMFTHDCVSIKRIL